MSHSKMLLIFSLIFAADSITQALHEESLVSPDEADLGMFIYQAAIMGKRNYTHELELVGSGTILSETIILTAAENFVDEYGNHRELTFAVFVGQTDITNPGHFVIPVDLIYLVDAGPFYMNNLALAKLSGILDFGANLLYLGWIDYSKAGDIFWNQSGVVSGYGYHNINLWFIPSLDGIIEDPLYADGELDNKLRFTHVEVSNKTSCRNGHIFVDFGKQFCGFMFPKVSYKKVGLCKSGLELETKANEFIANVKSCIPTIGLENLYNSDQSGFQLEIHSRRTLAVEGEKQSQCVVQSVSSTTHSYTIQPLISATEHLLSPLFLVLKETSGEFGPIVQKNLFKADNVRVEASTSGKLTTISALHGENLVSSNKARHNMFTYQVAIVAKRNLTYSLTLMCGGAILSEKLVLAAAQCFIDETGHHRELRFEVYAGKINVFSPGGIERTIDFIYLVAPGSYYSNNIAIAEIAGEFGIFFFFPNIRWIDYANENKTFWNEHGIISGYGYYYNNVIPTHFMYKLNSQMIIQGDTDYNLRYTTVTVTQYDSCIQGQLFVDFEKQFCGFTYPQYPGEKVGICKYDAGSPLVMGNMIVGVANSYHVDCNDVEIGGLYTNVASYSKFIDGVMFSNPIEGTLIYINRKHLPPGANRTV